MNTYRYGLIDLSYILSRNVYSCYKKDQDTPGDVVRSIIQTIGKLRRDFGIRADKYIFLNDTISKLHGGYFRSYFLGGCYKTSRTHTTKEDLEKLEKNPEVDEKELLKARENYKIGGLKKEAKRIILSKLGNFGIPCVSVEGWEVDDLVRLSSVLLDGEPSGKNSVIITKDSDLLYSLTPRLDYFRIPSAGSAPEIITYSQVWNSLSDGIKGCGLSLYDYKCYSDSLGSGHNDMVRTKKPKTNTDQIILEILQGNYENVENRVLFETQLNTFKVQEFPNFDEAQSRLIDAFTKLGGISSYSKFKEFCDSYRINTDYNTAGRYISENYYNSLIEDLDRSLYENCGERGIHF